MHRIKNPLARSVTKKLRIIKPNSIKPNSIKPDIIKPDITNMHKSAPPNQLRQISPPKQLQQSSNIYARRIGKFKDNKL